MNNVDLDICASGYDGVSDDQFSRDLAARHGCTATLVDPCGPAGGCPIYKFTGPRANLERLIVEYDGGNGDAEYLATFIE